MKKHIILNEISQAFFPFICSYIFILYLFEKHIKIIIGNDQKSFFDTRNN